MRTFARLFGRIVARGYPPAQRPDVESFVVRFIDDAVEGEGRGRRLLRAPALLLLLARDFMRDRRGQRAGRSFGRLPMHHLPQDIRLAVRSFKRAPIFASVAVITLALGIGASTTVFAIVDGSILRPFPYPDTARIVRLNERSARNSVMSVAYLNFLDWKAQSDAFAELGLYRNGGMTIAGDGAAARISVATVSASVFDTLGLDPVLGRRFDAQDDSRADRIVIISERLWRSRFGARPDAIGTSVRLNGAGHTIVGVMPSTLRFPSSATDAWLPFGLIVSTVPTGRDNHPGLFAIGRLRAGVSLDQARASMATVAKRLADTYPVTNAGNSIDVNSFSETIVGDARPVLLAFLGAAGLVLLIACANLVNMMLARGDVRQPEMVVRTALGAGRGRLIGQLLTEVAVLVTAGTALGIGLSVWLLSAFVASQPSTVPRLDQVALNWRVTIFAVVVALVTTAVVGVLPAIRASHPDLQSTLRDGRRAVAGGSRLRSALIIVEVALALMLLVGTGLLMKSFTALMSRDLGFQPAQVVTMRVGLPDARYATVESWTAFYTELRARFENLPGVTAIGLSAALPLEGVLESTVIQEGGPTFAESRTLGGIQVIDGNYFRALGSQLVSGRSFDARDRAGAVLVAVIDDAGAEKLFPGENPIGRRIAFESATEPPDAIVPKWLEVVGVVPHVAQYGLTGEPEYPQIFVPYGQLPGYMQVRRPAMAVVARVSGDPDAAVAAIRGIVASKDPGIPLFGVQTLTSILDEANERQRIGRLVFASVSFVALTLAVVGIYGVLSYSVAQRTREIGVRVALGARRGTIVGLVARQAGVLIAIGLATGAIGALWLSRALIPLLVNVVPGDPAVIAGAAAVVAVAAATATLLPARRAAAIDPVDALRND